MSGSLRKQDYYVLFCVGLLVSLALTVFQQFPGYMDAEYYYGGGLRLYEGQGFSEMMLWNYLDDPAGLPHASHAYWMPLPSLLAAAGMLLFQSRAYFAARSLFLLLAALVPPLTAFLAQCLGQERRGAYLAGWMGLFSGYYVIYTTLTEGFAITMILGSVFILTVFGPENTENNAKTKALVFLVPGVAAGLMHLTRADGVLWLAAGIVAVVWWYGLSRRASAGLVVAAAGWMITGYFVVMAGWYYRNWLVFGSFFAPGGSRTLWLQNYDQTFIYPAEQLTMQGWLANSWQTILQDRLAAMWTNLKTTLAVQGQVYLLPLMLIGLWKLRRDRRVILGMCLWLVIFGVMSLAFPFAGARGGFLHSGAAVQPLLWAVVPTGLQSFIDWGRRRRNWDARLAFLVFGIGLVVLGLMLSMALYKLRVVGDDFRQPIWAESWKANLALDQALIRAGAQDEDVVMINNPAGLNAATGRSAIVIPDGPLETSLQVAQRYGASYLILEPNHVDGLKELYAQPGDRQGLEYLAVEGGAYLYRIKGEK